MTKYIILTVLCGFFSISSLAQQVAVYDRSDLQPISQVTITNRQRTAMVVTDRLGKADIGVFRETDSLFFTHVAYQKYAATWHSLEKAGYRIYLTENIIKLDEFVISANRVRKSPSGS